MFTREKVEQILDKAREIDSGFELFGTKTHRYRLNPPVPEDFVRDVEEKCGFTLPEDYRRFITRVGDGGAGPYYGIEPFRDFWKRGYFQENRLAEWYRQGYRQGLARPFSVRPMEPEEAGRYGFSQEGYLEHPERYYVWVEQEDEYNERWSTEGFFLLGTEGCQWDFGIILNGEKRGRVFTTDNEGAFALDAHSFNEFYSQYLEGLSADRLRKQLEWWRGRFKH